MPTSAEHVLVDTSAALALVQQENPFHRTAKTRLSHVPPGNVRPCRGGTAVQYSRGCRRHSDSARLQHSGWKNRTFPSLATCPRPIPGLLREFAAAGLAGGALYDGLVAAAARNHKLLLVTCDRRAETTYRLLGVTYELLGTTPSE